VRNWQLFGLAVLIWGTTWHAITWQLQGSTPEFGVAVRFALAGLAALAWAAWRGERWRFSASEHLRIALQGIFMYSLAYLCVYHAEKHVPSGLVAVGYSASPLFNGVVAHWLWGVVLPRRFILGGVLGLVGVGMIFGREFIQLGANGDTGLGALFTLGAVLLSSVGSLVASRNKDRGLPLWPAMGWGMVYGALCSAAVVLATGQPIVWPSAPSWWGSLAYLAIAGSVIAFACYLTLQQRLGPGPASTVGVAAPVLALVVSTAFEGYQPGALAIAGVTLAVMGNAMALGLGSRRQPLEPQT
jgi:drug/metabolite transporter (DMT)-like permease